MSTQQDNSFDSVFFDHQCASFGPRCPTLTPVTGLITQHLLLMFGSLPSHFFYVLNSLRYFASCLPGNHPQSLSWALSISAQEARTTFT